MPPDGSSGTTDSHSGVVGELHNLIFQTFGFAHILESLKNFAPFHGKDIRQTCSVSNAEPASLLIRQHLTLMWIIGKYLALI